MIREHTTGGRLLNEFDETDQKESRLTPSAVGIFVAGYAFLLPPWLMYMTSGGALIDSVFWNINAYWLCGPLEISFRVFNLYLFPLRFLIIGAPQLVFLFFMYRLYAGKTTLKKTFGAGIIGFMPPLGAFFISLMWVLSGVFPISCFSMIPIPLLLPVCYVLVKIAPPPNTQSSWLESE
ncbi:MAG: hypothetical protein KGY80_14495 [Candidatus Thorarchaeota archaeon]|nr:hypothetical protein [Candidatus Thorarchaeota archaeon]